MTSLFIPWSTKNSLLRIFPIQFNQLLFVYLIVIHIIQIFTGVFYFLTFHPNLFFKNFTISKNSKTFRKTHFCNTSQAENRQQEREEAAQRQEEIEKLRELLTRALDQLALHDTEVSHLERKITVHSSSSENIIKSWQVCYHSLRESYLSLRRNIEELRRQHQEKVEKMSREHSQVYWNVNNLVSTINFYWERMMTRNIQLQAMYNRLDDMLVQRSKHFSFAYESHRLD